MKSDAIIYVWCDGDGCKAEEEISLCATARGGWDDRYVDKTLEQYGWKQIDSKDYCCDCDPTDTDKTGE